MIILSTKNVSPNSNFNQLIPSSVLVAVPVNALDERSLSTANSASQQPLIVLLSVEDCDTLVGVFSSNSNFKTEKRKKL